MSEPAVISWGMSRSYLWVARFLGYCFLSSSKASSMCLSPEPKIMTCAPFFTISGMVWMIR